MSTIDQAGNTENKTRRYRVIHDISNTVYTTVNGFLYYNIRVYTTDRVDTFQII